MELSPDYREVFHRNYLTYGMSEEVIQQVASLGSLVEFKVNETLIPRGARGEDLYVILNGKVHVYSEGGEKLSEMGPANVLGEIALVDAGPRSANAVAVTSVCAVRLPADKLRHFMAERRDLGFTMLANLARVLSTRLRQTSVALEDLAARSEDPWKLAT